MESYLTLIFTAVTIGVIHTLAGPDHYLPFVVLSKARGWSRVRTINIVILSGLGHVMSSVVIGFIGIFAGLSLSRIEFLEGFRGNIAAWLLFSFGVAYSTWAVFRLIKNKSHTHTHFKPGDEKKQLTFWIIFTIFVFGPCEPLIPILMYPAAERNYGAVALIALVFALATILTMVFSVTVLLRGFSLVKISSLERYNHLLAGLAISLCGAAILFLGL